MSSIQSNPTECQAPVVVSRGGKAISNEVRRQLIEAHESGVSYHKMTRLFGIKRDTAYRICSGRKYTTKARGGSRGKKIDGESISLLIRTIEARSDATLNELRDVLINERGLTASISTIARCLEDSLIRIGKSEILPTESSEHNALFLQSQLEVGAKICYVDACVFGLYSSRTRGRSAHGSPAARVAGGQWVPQVMLLCAMCPGVGLIHSKALIGPAEQTQVDEFIGDLFHISFGESFLSQGASGKRYILLRNSPNPCGIKDRLAGQIPRDLEFVRLPTFGVNLSPMETYFQSLQSYLKLHLSFHGPITPTEGQTKVQAKRLLLFKLCQNAMRELTPASCFHSLNTVICVIPVKLENIP